MRDFALPPHNIDLEQRVIGAILIMDGTVTASEIVSGTSSDVFYANTHKEIWESLKRILDSRGTLTRDDICIDLPDHLFAYVMEQYKNTSSASGVQRYVDELINYQKLRETRERIAEIQEVMYSNASVAEKLQGIESMFSADLGFHYGADGAKHIRDCIGNYLDDIEKRWTNPDSVVFSTGVVGLDEIMGGGYEIGLHAIAARPKMGKTELMVKMINSFSQRGPVFVGSLEMADYQMVHRMISQCSRLDKSEIYSNFANSQNYEADQAMFDMAVHNLSTRDVYIDDRFDLSINKIWRECRKIVKKHGSISGVFVDYLTLMKSETRFERRDLEIGHMTRNLKAMSKEFGCPVIILLQLNRSLESRPDKRPIPSDSRDSGSIEQDVDSWIGLYRDSVYNESSSWKNITEVILRLNRHGGNGTAYQLLTGHGFMDVDQDTIARLVHEEESKSAPKNSRSGTGHF